VARHQARADSDIDLLVDAPEDTSSFDFLRFKRLVEQVLGCDVDLISYGGPKPTLDDDIRHEIPLRWIARPPRSCYIKGWLEHVDEVVARGEDAC
jgi:hypothetical protein